MMKRGSSKKTRNSFLLSIVLLILGFAVFEAWNVFGILLAVIIAIVLVPWKKSFTFASILFVAATVVIQAVASVFSQLSETCSKGCQVTTSGMLPAFTWGFLASLATGLLTLFFVYIILGGLRVSTVEGEAKKVVKQVK